MTLNKMRKKIHYSLTPAQQIALSFAFVILTGGILLSLPISNKVVGTPFIDHLFTSTSAVCVTGLSTIVLADQYTVFGQWVIIGLMQIGGLGLMTLIAVFVIFLSGKLTLSNRLALNEAVNFFNLNDFNHFIKAILKYTLFFELIGIILLSTRFVPIFGLSEGLADTTKIKIKTDAQGTNKQIEQEVHRVQILDPATGTGTFLCEVVKYIYLEKFQNLLLFFAYPF